MRLVAVSLLASLAALVVLLSARAPLAHLQDPLSLFPVKHLRLPGDRLVASMSVSPASVNTTGQQVTVSWSGVPSPAALDYVAMYCPPPAGLPDMQSRAPVKFALAGALSPSSFSAGSGSAATSLLNVRDDCAFLYVSQNATVLAQSPTVTQTRPNEVVQVRLSMVSGAPTVARVHWVSRDASQPAVQWGAAADRLTNSAPASTVRRVARGDMCGDPATTIGFHDSGALITARMTSLPLDGSRVYYRVGDPATGEWSSVRSFVPPPPAGAGGITRVYAFGDMGSAPPQLEWTEPGHTPEVNATTTMQRMLEAAPLFQPQAVVHIGDISYARGFATHWDEWQTLVEPLASAVPWMQSPGNHERDFPGSGSLFNGTDSGGECGVAYEARFPNPREAAPLDEPWYSFDVGLIHFVMMSTEHDFSEGSEQYKFIQTDLAAVDRKVTPWVIFTGHRPMYVDSLNSGPPASDQGTAEMLRQSVEPLLLQNRVDLGLWGHFHAYSRSCRVFNTTCLSPTSQQGPYTAPVHLVIGMAGQGLTGAIFEPTRPAWEEYRNGQEYGYSRIWANQTVLQLQFVQNVDGTVADELALDNSQYAHVHGL